MAKTKKPKPFDYGYQEFRFGQHGVFWRTSGAAQHLYEELERKGWRIFLYHTDLMVLRRRIPKPRPRKKKPPFGDIFN